jgi:hypothetical protein
MSNINLMTIFDAAEELCHMNGKLPDSPASGLYQNVTNHEFEYAKLSRKYKDDGNYSGMEQTAINKVQNT